MPTPIPRRVLLAALLSGALAATAGPAPAARAADAGAPWASPEGTALLAALTQSKYKFTAQVRAAYLAWAKAQALADIQAAGKALPKDFLAWVNKDPIIEATVYGSRPQAAPVLMELCALWLDMGPKDAAKYKQLLLAAAVAASDEGANADLSPRKPMLLEIPAPPEANNPLAKRDPLPTTAQTCAFVIRNQEFNFSGSEDRAYKEKKAKEQQDAAAAARKDELERRKEELKNKGKKKAPAAPQAAPAPAPKRFTGKRKWPAFDIAGAPWPMLTPLIENRLPLREAEGIWQEYVQTGTVEFTEGITNDPSPFGPGSWQALRRSETGNKVPLYLGRDLMMGIPSMMGKHYEYAAPCHFSYGRDSGGNYQLIPHSQMGSYMPQECEGWPYGAHPARGLRREFWQRSMTYAVNRGLKEYLDACMVLNLFAALPAEEKSKHGTDLLESGLVINPYHIELALAYGAQARTAVEVVDAHATFNNALLAARKTGCPQTSEYSNALLAGWVGRLASLPVPAEKAEALKILGFLKIIRHPDSALRLRYQAVAMGATSVRDRVDCLMDEHLAGARTPQKCQAMAKEISAAAASFEDPAKKEAWLKEARSQFAGQEDYPLPVTVANPHSLAPSPGAAAPHPQVVGQKLMTDEAAQLLAELTKQPLPDVSIRHKKFLDKVAETLKKQVDAQRDPLQCQTMACQIKMLAEQIEDKPKRDAWLKKLAAIMKGNESYLTLVAVKESQGQFPEKIMDDETDKTIVELLNGVREPETKRIEKSLRQATLLFKMQVGGRRSGGSCAHMAKLVPALAGQIRDEAQKTAWVKDLCRIIYHREEYQTTANGPRYRDPTADVLYKLFETLNKSQKK